MTNIAVWYIYIQITHVKGGIHYFQLFCCNKLPETCSLKQHSINSNADSSDVSKEQAFQQARNIVVMWGVYHVIFIQFFSLGSSR